MENQDNDFLEVRLDRTGIDQLKKLSVTTRWLFILGMLLTLLLFVRTVVHSPFMSAEEFSANLPLYLEAKLFNWYTALYCLFFAWQVWCYWQFARQANKGAALLDTAQFNHSFRALYRSSVLALVHLCLTIVMAVLEVLVAFHIAALARALHK